MAEHLQSTTTQAFPSVVSAARRETWSGRQVETGEKMAYSVAFRYPGNSLLRKGGSLFCLLRLRCGHEHLTIRSAAECKDRLVKSSRFIGYTIGRFGKVEETTTHRVVTDAEIRNARATELDTAEAFRIVLALARQNIIRGREMTGERARRTAACDIVEKFVVRLR
jgi:hypothetical protein